MIELERLLARIPVEAADAVVGMVRPRSMDLARHLRGMLGTPAGGETSLLSAPYLEGAFPWLPVRGGWDGVDPNLLDPATSAVLRKVSPYPPYAHQVEAWSKLCNETPASVIVSSGTGSGKTECFLTPVLDRLVRKSGGGKVRLSGVRALMLYPLNALISSQEERLAKWFQPFRGALRYCLYNGETPEEVPGSQAQQEPWKVRDRKTLRKDPPPVLVTNITMLEYMLIRQKDSPILTQSQGTLDFIILDEAHSYIGAQAAELSLLLRRVALAFGKEPKDIRYVATSATIGTGAREELRDFLRDLSGAPESNVHVVTGTRAPLPEAPELTSDPIDLSALGNVDSSVTNAQLAKSRPLRELRERMRSDGIALSWSQWKEEAAKIAGPSADASELLVKIASAKDPYADNLLAEHGGDSLLPSRVHIFQRTVTGLWACTNPGCHGRPAATNGDWPHGAVYLERREKCQHCQSIVLEWAFCTRCGEGALKGDVIDEGTRLAPWNSTLRDDGFEQTLDRDENFGLDPDNEDDGDSDQAPISDHRYLRLWAGRPVNKLRVDLRTGKIDEEASDGAIVFEAHRDVAHCPCCGFPPNPQPDDNGVLRGFVAGAPFLMSQIAASIVGRLTPNRTSDEALPFDGRQLITFTDARQGTARHAATIQVASERNYIRSFLYHFVQERPRADRGAIEELNRQIEALRTSNNADLLALIPPLEERLKVASGAAAPKTWKEMVRRLASQETVYKFLREVWEPRDETFGNPEVLAEFLLYREIMRRPVRSNSAETLGLVKILLPFDVDDTPLPAAAARLGVALEDWRDILRLLLTHFLRTNVILDFPAWKWMRWIDRRQSQISVQRRKEPGAPSQKYTRYWPNPFGHSTTRVVGVLAQGLGLSYSDHTAQDEMEALLEAAWVALLKFMTPGQDGRGYRFRMNELYVAPLEKAFWCPTTRRIVDTTFRGLSPYDASGRYPTATPIDMPKLPFVWGYKGNGETVSYAEMDSWLGQDEKVRHLRDIGVWGDQQERAARFATWMRTAEHSAQQPSFLLRAYEAEFKRGLINLMACSTTMEMGVDIGSIEAVLNTNAPPAIANYRQRVGRAGRARQPIALAWTMCKDQPLDRFAFANPAEFLGRQAPAPRVTLQSPTIARRHAHAYLLATFLKERAAELHRLTNSRFFGIGIDPAALGGAGFPCDQFIAWLGVREGDVAAVAPLRTILIGTPISANSELFEVARDAIEDIKADLTAEWEALAGDAGTEDIETVAADKARRLQRKRLEQNYLLGELAGRGFLPSYGFPTDVVPFITITAEEKLRDDAKGEDKNEDENRLRSRGWPSRQRDLAIFEYAPGRGIVVDGVVRESQGVTLNWKRPADAEDVREVQSIRQVHWCKSCGTLLSTPSAIQTPECSQCGGTDFNTVRYLAPAGFAVDVRFQIHDDTRDLGGAAPEDPWVSARTSAWRALPDARVGRVRASADGKVFWFNRGPNHHGFEVCLHCGRAAAESGPNTPSSLINHRPLRGSPKAEDGATCTGGIVNDAPFAIARNLSLGQELRTDVCELQLYDCESREAALTIALALREVVARDLGVDADEMGFAAPEAMHPQLGYSRSAVIFDRASGGAGFSAKVASDPVGYLRRARDLLNCQSMGRCGDANAVKACPRCVLSADSQHSVDHTDRKAAYDLLTMVLARLDLPLSARIFGDTSVYEPAPLPEAIFEELQRDSSIRLSVPMHGAPTDWELESWNLSPVLERLGSRGRSVSLLVDRDGLLASDVVTRRQFALWAQRARVSLRTADPSVPRLLAIATDGRKATAWASTVVEANVVGSTWASASEGPIVRGQISPLAEGEELPIESLLSPDIREALVELAAELDGPATGFGARLRRMLAGSSPRIEGVLEGQMLSVSYTDRYLFSPLAVRLAAELIAGFASSETKVVVTTLGIKRSGQLDGRVLQSDWVDLSSRSLVLGELLKEITPNAALIQKKWMGHRRRLDFVTDRGTGTIFFDQGVGSWKVSSRIAFDHFTPVLDQIAAVKAPFEVRNDPDGTYLAVRIHD